MGFCEHGDELLGVKTKEFFIGHLWGYPERLFASEQDNLLHTDRKNDYQLLKKELEQKINQLV